MTNFINIHNQLLKDMPHLKRLLAPSFWRVPKKEKKWVVTPHAGPHPKLQSIPLSIILTHITNVADTTTEAKKMKQIFRILSYRLNF